MRKLLLSIPVVISLAGGIAHAEEGQAYSVETTDIGTLIDNPATAEILEKYMPGFTTNGQVAMTRGFTLKSIQSYAPDMISEEALEGIEADLSALEANGR